jgi:hypothetical protein
MKNLNNPLDKNKLKIIEEFVCSKFPHYKMDELLLPGAIFFYSGNNYTNVIIYYIHKEEFSEEFFEGKVLNQLIEDLQEKLK